MRKRGTEANITARTRRFLYDGAFTAIHGVPQQHSDKKGIWLRRHPRLLDFGAPETAHQTKDRGQPLRCRGRGISRGKDGQMQSSLAFRR